MFVTTIRFTVGNSTAEYVFMERERRLRSSLPSEREREREREAKMDRERQTPPDGGDDKRKRLSLSLSLSHTHTCTHGHVHTFRLSLSHTHTHANTHTHIAGNQTGNGRDNQRECLKRQTRDGVGRNWASQGNECLFISRLLLNKKNKKKHLTVSWDLRWRWEKLRKSW